MISLIELSILSQALIAIAAIFLNGILLYSTFLPMPKGFRSYSVLWTRQTLTDLLAATCILASLPHIVPCEMMFVSISYGPCAMFGGAACYALYALLIACYASSFINVAVCMVCRLLLVRTGLIRRLRLIAWSALAADSPAALIFVAVMCMRIEDCDGEHALHRQYDYETDRWQVSAIGIQTTGLLIATFFIHAGSLSLMSFIWVYRAKILRILDAKKGIMSASTRIVHQQFVSCLTLQALLPLFTLLNMTLLLFGIRNVFSGAVVEVPVIFSLILPAFFSPIILITHIKHYRRTIFNLLCKLLPCKQEAVTPLSDIPRLSLSSTHI